MKKIMCIILFVASGLLMAQNKKVVTTNGEIVNYDVRVTTTQRDALPNKTVGLLIFNTTTNCHEYWNGTAWYNYCWKGTTEPPVTPPPGQFPSTGGSAVVTAYNCSGTFQGILLAGTPVEVGVTKTITATVASVGTYYITAFANGVTFTGSGTFAGIGTQTIVLTATGTPTATGDYTYTLSTSPTCSFSLPTMNLITGAAGKKWMDRNLGASRVATSYDDYLSYGSLYQWGRGSDGHQLINWTSSTSGTPQYGSTTALSSTDTPGHSYFIYTSSGGGDWRTTKNDLLWQGYSGTNNPCPTGYRLPTYSEWAAEFSAAGITEPNTAFTKLKLPAAGKRDGYAPNQILNQTSNGVYWSSSIDVAQADAIVFAIFGGVYRQNSDRETGCSVRCLKD